MTGARCSRRRDPPRNTLLTHDHARILGWITLAVFCGAIWMLGSRGEGVNIGVGGWAVGLILESSALKRTFTPILGLALLYGISDGISAYLTAPSVPAEPDAPSPEMRG